MNPDDPVATQSSKATKPTYEKVEHAAEQMFNRYNHQLKGFHGLRWGEIGGAVQEQWRQEARAALEAALTTKDR